MALLTKLEEQLVKIREAAEEREAERKAGKAGISYLDATSIPIKVDVLKLIPEEIARRARVAAFETKKPDVALAVFEPDSPETKKIIKALEGQDLKVKLFAVSLRGLEHIWSFYKFVPSEKPPITSRVNIEKERIIGLAEKLTSIKNVAQAIKDFDFDNLSVTDFLEIVLSGALANRTSDIHFEPEEKAVKLRYRIDGLLNDVTSGLNNDFYPSITSRIKLLSNLKINVQDRPQDGRFTIGLPSKDIEIRVAVAPSEYGEIIVMRILDPDVINLSLTQLGLRPDDLEIIETELKRPNGMILNTGPTGSGKTTTLYAFLKAKYSQEIKIITIEDPIEYHVQGIEQTQVNEGAGYTFANGLRSIMRQDPDAILVGEVRDKDTAEIAIQAALTGHLVFSTIHANDAPGAIPRFLDLGVKPTSIGPALNLIIAQRLVRRLCDKCKIPSELNAEARASLKNFLGELQARVNKEPFKEIKLFKPRGCKICGDSGYKGRIAIFELLLNDPEYEKVKSDPSHEILSSEHWLEELIKKQAGETEIMQSAVEKGMTTMQEDGVLKVISGITTFEEVEEVTGPIQWLKRH